MHFEEKESSLKRRFKQLLNQSQKDFTYEYILAFARWWSIFWKVVDSSGYILTGGGGWGWIYFSGWWVLVDVGGWQ